MSALAVVFAAVCVMPVVGATPAPKKLIYVAVGGSDANPGSAGAPVATFARAYQLAKPGQAVAVTSGDYPYQRLIADGAKRTSAHVVFSPAPGATVHISLIDFGQGQEGVPGPSHVTLRNMSVDYLRAWEGTSDVVWRNISGRSFAVISATKVSVLGGSYGPCLAPRDAGCTPLLLGSNLVVDGVSFHDQTLDPRTDAHVDGVFVRGCQRCVVRNSKFWGNMITNMRIQDCCGVPPSSDITLENNFFAAPLTGEGRKRFDAIDVDTPVPNLVLRANSMVDSGIGLLNATETARALVVGNIFGRSACDPNATYKYNLYVPFSAFTGQNACSSSERKLDSFATVGFISADTHDLHLAPRSPALRRVAASSCPRTDIDRQKRWPGRKCDAGADQRTQTICRRVGRTKRVLTADVDPEKLPAYRRRGATLGPCPQRR